MFYLQKNYLDYANFINNFQLNVEISNSMKARTQTFFLYL